jgi:hypothetical protein
MLLFRWKEGDATYAGTIAPVLDARGSGAPPDLARFLASFARDLRCENAGGAAEMRLACTQGVSASRP